MRSNNELLNPATRTRLAKLLGMTQSSHDGEALNAIRLANRVLAESKITWTDALAVNRRSPPPPPEPPEDWRSAALFCTQFGLGVLSKWERDFCRSLLDFPRLSDKQAAILLRCYERCAA